MKMQNTPKILHFIASEHDDGERLDRWLNSQLSEYSRQQIQNAIKNKNITVNDLAVPQKYKIMMGDVITGHIEHHSSPVVLQQNISLNIIFEDEHILVLNKPAGLVTHPGHGNHDNTLLNGIVYHCPDNLNLPKHGLIHRLDKDTSGLLICAKSNPAYQKLITMMQNRELSRRYDALCWRQPRAPTGTIQTQIGRHPSQRTKMSVVVDGKIAITHYQLVRVFTLGSQIRFELETGRTHQIRVHAHHEGFPIIGDPIYQTRHWTRNLKGLSNTVNLAIRDMKRQALHAQELSFNHPITHERLIFKSDWPQDMLDLYQQLDKV